MVDGLLNLRDDGTMLENEKQSLKLKASMYQEYIQEEEAGTKKGKGRGKGQKGRGRGMGKNTDDENTLPSPPTYVKRLKNKPRQLDKQDNNFDYYQNKAKRQKPSEPEPEAKFVDLSSQDPVSTSQELIPCVPRA